MVCNVKVATSVLSSLLTNRNLSGQPLEFEIWVIPASYPY